MPKLWNRDYCKTMVSNFMLFFSFYLLTPLLPIYLDEQFHADKDLIGLVLSGYIVAALVVRPFSGFLVDSFPRKTVLLVCFFAFFILFTGYIGAGTILMFAIVRTLHGLPYGATTVANSTVAIDVLHPSRRSEGIGYYGLSNNIAMAIAPSVGIFIYKVSGSFQLLFWISLFVAALGVVAVATIRTRPRELATERPPLSLDRFFLKVAWVPALNIAFFSLCWGVMSNYVALYGKLCLGITDGTGIFFALLSGGLIVSRLSGAKSLRQGLLTRNAIMGGLISCVGFTLFALALGKWSYFASAVFIGLGNGKMYPAFLNMFNSLALPSQRGTANSSILTSWDAGMGIGILLGGVLIEYVGFSAAFWATAVSQISATLMAIFISRPYFRRHSLDPALR